MIFKFILSLFYVFALKHKFKLAYYKHVISVYKKKKLHLDLYGLYFACTVTGHLVASPFKLV